MKYCIYLTIYKGSKLPKRYIGSSSVDRVNKGYNGSIKSKIYKEIYKFEQLNNKHLFKTRILKRFYTHKEAIEAEKQLQLKYQVHRSPEYMNMSIANPHGYFGRNVDKEKHPFYAKSHNEETKQKISKTLKEKYNNKELISPFASYDFSGKNNPFHGHNHTEESKNKMRKPKKYVPKWKCKYCDRFFDGGNFTQHMIKKHNWDNIKIVEYKSEQTN